MDIITYPCWDKSSHMLVKGPVCFGITSLPLTSRMITLAGDHMFAQAKQSSVCFTFSYSSIAAIIPIMFVCCPACRTYEIATRFCDVPICRNHMCLTVYEFSFILFDLCLFITIFNLILNNVLKVTFWIFAYYKIWIMLIIYCFIWNYWIIHFVTCLEVFWSVLS